MDESILWDIYSKHQKRLRFYYIIILISSAIIWFTYLRFCQTSEHKSMPVAKHVLSIITRFENYQNKWSYLNGPLCDSVKEVCDYIINSQQLIMDSTMRTEFSSNYGETAKCDKGSHRLIKYIGYSNNHYAIIPFGITRMGDLIDNWSYDIHNIYKSSDNNLAQIVRIYHYYLASKINPSTIFCLYKELATNIDSTNSLMGILSRFRDSNWIQIEDYELSEDDIKEVFNFISKIKQSPVSEENIEQVKNNLQTIINSQPSPKLPIIGENIDGRIAFIVFPLFIMACYYLFFMSIISFKKQDYDIKNFSLKFPSVLALLAGSRRDKNLVSGLCYYFNKILLFIALFMPLSTIWPIMKLSIDYHWLSDTTFLRSHFITS